MTLEQYFHTIINKPRIIEFKEPSMFDNIKTYFKNVKEAWTSLYTWDETVKRTKAYEEMHNEIEGWKAGLNTPNEFQPEPLKGEEDYWVFEMHTPAYECDGEAVPMKHNILMDANDSTWHDTLDQILDVMGEHYGYNIKEQVYYSVAFPMNIEGNSGHGRMLNDEVVQKLLLAYPEVYETRVTDFAWKPL